MNEPEIASKWRKRLALLGFAKGINSTRPPCFACERVGAMPIGEMTIKEVLTDWQAGGMTARRAMMLTGASDVLELYALMEVHGVETRFTLSEGEQRSVKAVMAAVERARNAKGPSADHE